MIIKPVTRPVSNFRFIARLTNHIIGLGITVLSNGTKSWRHRKRANVVYVVAHTYVSYIQRIYDNVSLILVTITNYALNNKVGFPNEFIFNIWLYMLYVSYKNYCNVYYRSILKGWHQTNSKNVCTPLRGQKIKIRWISDWKKKPK